MKISATSALVLNWTAADVWESEAAKAYTEGLDLSEANELLALFSPEEHYMHLQAVSNRKYFVRKQAMEFCNKCKLSGTLPQVIVLAAGIAPLSVEIASLHPEALLFDVDKYLMSEKEQYLDGRFPNIHFLTCDITDLSALSASLQLKGWTPEEPTLVILEGITYYLSTTALAGLIHMFAGVRAEIAGDFALESALVNTSVRNFGVQVFRKISDAIGLDNIQLYAPTEFMGLLNRQGYQFINRVLLQDIQREFRGKSEPFEGPEAGWISLFAASV